MTNWEKLNERSHPNSEAEWAVVNFILNTYFSIARARGSPGRALDIGCGRSAHHVRYMQALGIACVGIDPSPLCLAHYHCTWAAIETQPIWDLILDIKTLCHEPEPDYQKVYDSLGVDGILFCICPTDDHLSAKDAFDIAKGKDYTRMLDEKGVRAMLSMFPDIRINKEIRPIGPQQRTYSWLIEARK